MAGSRRGPVNEPATTRNDPIARERKRRAHGPDGGDAAGQRIGPCYLAKVGVAGSNPVVRSKEVAGQTQRRLDAAPRQPLRLPQTCRTVPRSQRLGDLLLELLASKEGSPLGDVVGAELNRDGPPGRRCRPRLQAEARPQAGRQADQAARRPDARPHVKQSVRSGSGSGGCGRLVKSKSYERSVASRSRSVNRESPQLVSMNRRTPENSPT